MSNAPTFISPVERTGSSWLRVILVVAVLAWTGQSRMSAATAQLVVEPTIMGFTVFQGQIARRELRISNPGAAPLVWSLDNGTDGWMVLPTTMGQTQPGETTILTLTIDPGSRPLGELRGTLTVTGNDGGNPWQVLLYGTLLAFPGTTVAPGIVESATYEIRNIATGQVLDVAGASRQVGAAVIQWPAHGGANQRWTITAAAGGGYRLTAKHSGQVLSVVDGSTAEGALLRQQPDAGADSQRWYIDYAPTGFHLFAKHSGKRLGVPPGSGSGARVAQQVDTASENQQWVLSIQPDPTIVSGATYKLTAQHSGDCLDVAGASTVDGANVWSWHDNGTTAQRWRIEREGDGWRLVAACSGMALEVPYLYGGGNDVVQGVIDGGPNQRWHFVDMGDGWYKIASAHTFEILDVAGRGTADGTDVITWRDNRQSNQRWRLDLIVPPAVASSSSPTRPHP
jgi:hypothetical protein